MILGLSEIFWQNLASMIVLFSINYIKIRADNKGFGKKNADEHKFLTDKIERFEKKADFSESLFNKMTLTGINVVHHNTDLDSDIIRLMNTSLQKIRSFAVRHIASSFRITRNNLIEYIKISTIGIYEDLDSLADILFPEKNNKKYSDFVKTETNQLKLITDLTDKLITNGMSEKEYKDLFVKFIEQLFKEQIKGWRLWNRF